MSRDTVIGTYLALGAQALAPIIIGSFSSLKAPISVRRKLRKAIIKAGQTDQDQDDVDDDDDEEEDEDEHLTLADSLWFPVLGSIALLSLYLLLKYVGEKTINLLIGGYFGFLGIFAVQNSTSVLTTFILRLLSVTPETYHLRLTQSRSPKPIIHQKSTLQSLLLLPISIALPPLYLYLNKPWYLTNVLGFAFAQGAIQVLKLDSFKTGAALLGGLFFYDVFWVFGTGVMVSVAKGLDAPIKILAPRGKDFAMLGLGDIVIPGLVIAFCLRFDYARARITSKCPDLTPRDAFPKPYFLTTLVAYVAGLVTTVVVMHRFRAAQPALLYLSPACVGAPMLCAFMRGELAELWSWAEEGEKADRVEGKTKTAEESKETVIGEVRNEAVEQEQVSTGNGTALKMGSSDSNSNSDSLLFRQSY